MQFILQMMLKPNNFQQAEIFFPHKKTVTNKPPYRGKFLRNASIFNILSEGSDPTISILIPNGGIFVQLREFSIFGIRQNIACIGLLKIEHKNQWTVIIKFLCY